MNQQCNLAAVTGFRCSGIAEANGKCARHNKMNKIRDERQKMLDEAIIQENNKKERVQKFKNDIQKKIAENPQMYTINLSERFAANKPNWIYYEEYDKYCQFDANGEIAVTCDCSGCSKLTAVELQIKNRHCTACACYDCVCEARRISNKYNKYSIFPEWEDVACGSCIMCKKSYDDDKTCIIN